MFLEEAVVSFLTPSYFGLFVHLANNVDNLGHRPGVVSCTAHHTERGNCPVRTLCHPENALAPNDMLPILKLAEAVRNNRRDTFCVVDELYIMAARSHH
ncbi:MAG: hypothetical protein JKX91_13005 [Rhizobiaceae bacterium]|nr:hypothetical protein [Rhizobiaceae bacterium]